MAGTMPIASSSGASELGQYAVAEERADHVHVPVREVEQLQDPVHHRVPQGDQRVEAAEHEAVPQQRERSSPAQGADVVDDAEEQDVQGDLASQKHERPTGVGRSQEHVKRAT